MRFSSMKAAIAVVSAGVLFSMNALAGYASVNGTTFAVYDPDESDAHNMQRVGNGYYNANGSGTVAVAGTIALDISSAYTHWVVQANIPGYGSTSCTAYIFSENGSVVTSSAMSPTGNRFSADLNISHSTQDRTVTVFCYLAAGANITQLQVDYHNG